VKGVSYEEHNEHINKVTVNYPISILFSCASTQQKQVESGDADAYSIRAEAFVNNRQLTRPSLTILKLLK